MREQPGQSRANRPLDRQVEVLRLRTDGRTVREIAAALEIGVATVQRDLEAAKLAAVTPLVEELRDVESTKLDVLEQRTASVLADPKSQDVLLKAIDTARRLQERRARLYGLDQPVPAAAAQPAAVQHVEVGPQEREYQAMLRGVRDYQAERDDQLPPHAAAASDGGFAEMVAEARASLAAYCGDGEHVCTCANCASHPKAHGHPVTDAEYHDHAGGDTTAA